MPRSTRVGRCGVDRRSGVRYGADAFVWLTMEVRGMIDTTILRRALCSARYEITVTFERTGHAPSSPHVLPYVEATCTWQSPDGLQCDHASIGRQDPKDPLNVADFVELMEGLDGIPGVDVKVLLYPAVHRLFECDDVVSGRLEVRWGHDRQGADGAEVRASGTLADGQRVMRGTVGIDPAYGSTRSILNVVNAVISPPADD